MTATPNHLSLYTTRGIAAGQSLHFLAADHVEVAGDGVLQGRGGHCKLERLALVVGIGEQTMDEATREGVATAHAVDDGVDVVMLALIELLTIVNQGLPAIVGSREGLAEGGHYILESKLLHHALEDAIVTLGICLAAFYISLGLEAKAELGVFLVADTYVNILHQGLHDALGLLRGPQLLAEVEVDTHGHAVTLGSLTGQTGELGSLIADGGCDTAPVEPVGTLHNLVEVEIGGVGLGNGTAGTVVDDLGGTHGGSGLQIVDAHTVATAGDEIRVYAKLAQSVDGTLANLVLGQLGYEVGLVAIVCAAYSHIGFSTAIYHIKVFTLNESFLTWGGKTEHDFS